MNSLPAGTTLAAKASFPISERSCRLVAFRRSCHLPSSCRSSFSLVGGSLNSWSVESSSIPRKVRVDEGPSTLSMATGIPKDLHKDRVLSLASPQAEESGGPVMK